MRPPAREERDGARTHADGPVCARAGRVIHEFDPWFNYRATEFMAANGWDKFQVRTAAAHPDTRTSLSLGK